MGTKGIAILIGVQCPPSGRGNRQGRDQIGVADR
jgi:hypothetical protein